MSDLILCDDKKIWTHSLLLLLIEMLSEISRRFDDSLLFLEHIGRDVSGTFGYLEMLVLPFLQMRFTNAKHLIHNNRTKR